jgi:hypothetical protein
MGCWAGVRSGGAMASRDFADYGIDPLGLSAEDNEQVASPMKSHLSSHA